MTPYWQSEGVRLYQGDCRAVMASLPAGSVQTCVTSPPYFGLRSYSGGDLEIGAEGDLDAYIANLVAVFGEVRRVLRDNGTCWVNLGDAYAGSSMSGGVGSGTIAGTQQGARKGADLRFATKRETPGLKSKDLIGVPWRVAFALQADGWYLRSAVVWHKPNAMPESVRDRPTMDYEMVFLLSKRAAYFYDAEAVKESAADSTLDRTQYGPTWGTKMQARRDLNLNSDKSRLGSYQTGRNRRAVWSIPTQPLKAAHFAAWPEKLVEPMILAGTSERGACGSCGAAWVRETRRETIFRSVNGRDRERNRGGRADGFTKMPDGVAGASVMTTGWSPSCTCPPADPVPCVILDPFCGSGRAGVVARKLGRHFWGIDLNPAYLDLSRAQISAVQPPLAGVSA